VIDYIILMLITITVLHRACFLQYITNMTLIYLTSTVHSWGNPHAQSRTPDNKIIYSTTHYYKTLCQEGCVHAQQQKTSNTSIMLHLLNHLQLCSQRFYKYIKLTLLNGKLLPGKKHVYGRQ